MWLECARSTHLEVLEPEDVQDADGLEVFVAPDAAVEFPDDPVETLRVKGHGHGVSGVHRLRSRDPRHRDTMSHTEDKVNRSLVLSPVAQHFEMKL